MKSLAVTIKNSMTMTTLGTLKTHRRFFAIQENLCSLVGVKDMICNCSMGIFNLSWFLQLDKHDNCIILTIFIILQLIWCILCTNLMLKLFLIGCGVGLVCLGLS